MPSGTRKAKCTFRRIAASKPISASELETAERLLARFVALAYARDNPDLFSSEANKRELAALPGSSGHARRCDGPGFSCSEVPLLARTAAAVDATQYE
jgi:hypothetical protein